MSGHHKWSELRDKHLTTPAAKAAYERARVKLDREMAIYAAINEILQQAALSRDVDEDQVEPLTDAIYNEVIGVLDPGTLLATKKPEGDDG